MSGQKSPSGSKLEPRITFRRILIFLSVVLFLAGVGVRLFYLFKGEKVPEGAIDLLKWIGGIILGDYLILYIENRLSERAEREKAIRDKLMEPARRELTKEDIGGAYYPGEGEIDQPIPSQPFDGEN